MELLQDNNKQTISSREIAELTGKRHSDILEAIRNMERKKSTNGNFRWLITKMRKAK